MMHRILESCLRVEQTEGHNDLQWERPELVSAGAQINHTISVNCHQRLHAAGCMLSQRRRRKRELFLKHNTGDAGAELACYTTLAPVVLRV